MAIAVLATILPSFIIILIIAMLFQQFAEITLVQKAFHSLRPAVVALIAVPLIQMSRQSGLTLSNFWFPLIVAILVGFLKISPVYLILITIAFAVYQGLKKQKL